MSKPIILNIDMIGGNCPVQAEGTIDGHEFYFRARHDKWTLHVSKDGKDPLHETAWRYSEPFEGAGWMDEHDALVFIKKGAHIWADQNQ